MGHNFSSASFFLSWATFLKIQKSPNLQKLGPKIKWGLIIF